MPIERAQQPMAYTRTMPDIAPQVWAQRGQVISSDDETSFDMAKLPSGSKASTMIYRSTSGIDGAPTVVSGALFVPPGDAPDGGWPVISYAHYTTGVSQGAVRPPTKNWPAASRSWAPSWGRVTQWPTPTTWAWATSVPSPGRCTLPGAEIGCVQRDRRRPGRPHPRPRTVGPLGGGGEFPRWSRPRLPPPSTEKSTATEPNCWAPPRWCPHWTPADWAIPPR